MSNNLLFFHFLWLYNFMCIKMLFIQGVRDSLLQMQIVIVVHNLKKLKMHDNYRRINLSLGRIDIVIILERKSTKIIKLKISPY